jgi:16S rRNA (uracil1498-N3)-methyltransferase
MALPFFYLAAYDPGTSPETAEITLDEDNSRHIVQVLRMKTGDALQLTDGKGSLLTAIILDDHKKKCRVKVQSKIDIPTYKKKVAIAISPLKNASRFEWFLEKAAEIGVSEIIPLQSERTERQHLRPERLHNILVSALLQSQQVWLPILYPLTPFLELLDETRYDRRLIAHCLEDSPPTSVAAGPSGLAYNNPSASTLILIGPEGDFSAAEVASALKNGFVPVSLGENRLRTETAGVVAATLLCI